MKHRILIIALIIGIFTGYALFTSSTPTSAMTACFAENQPCECNTTECQCGNLTMPADYCLFNQTLQESN